MTVNVFDASFINNSSNVMRLYFVGDALAEVIRALDVTRIARSIVQSFEVERLEIVVDGLVTTLYPCGVAWFSLGDLVQLFPVVVGNLAISMTCNGAGGQQATFTDLESISSLMDTTVEIYSYKYCDTINMIHYGRWCPTPEEAYDSMMINDPGFISAVSRSDHTMVITRVEPYELESRLGSYSVGDGQPIPIRTGI